MKGAEYVGEWKNNVVSCTESTETLLCSEALCSSLDCSGSDPEGPVWAVLPMEMETGT